MAKHQPHLSIIVPCYNEEANLPVCVEAIETWIGRGVVGTVEVILVDDGSRDRTWEIIETTAGRNKDFRGLRLATNRGSHVALRCGYQHCAGRFIVNLPADLQEPIENIDQMLDIQKQSDAEAVLAVRKSRDDGLGNTISSRLYHLVLHLLKLKQVPLEGASQFLMTGRLGNVINTHSDRTFTLDGFFASAPIKLEVMHYARLPAQRPSRWSFTTKLNHALDTILGFSNIPIRALSLTGAVTALVGFVYAIVIIFNAFLNGAVPPGWSSLTCLVLVLSGLNLLALGMLGEYAWRILDESRRNPLFQLEAKVGFDH